MDRVDGANTIDIGGGRRGFRSQDAGAGLAGTEVTSQHMNALQEEVLHVIEQNGLVPDGLDWTQLYQALQAMIAGIAFPGPGDPPKPPNLPRLTATTDRSQVIPYNTDINIRWDVVTSNNFPDAAFDGQTFTVGATGAGLYFFDFSAWCNPQPVVGISLYFRGNAVMKRITGIGGVSSSLLAEMNSGLFVVAPGDAMTFACSIAWVGGGAGASTFDPTGTSLSITQLATLP